MGDWASPRLHNHDRVVVDCMGDWASPRLHNHDRVVVVIAWETGQVLDFIIMTGLW